MKKIIIGKINLIVFSIFVLIPFAVFFNNVKIYASSKLPDLPKGATPLKIYHGLIPTYLKTRDQLFYAELKNIQKANKNYFSIRKDPVNWFKINTLKKIHQDMFGEVWHWAGIFYRGPKRNIGIETSQISFQMEKLCRNIYNFSKSQTCLSFLEQSARILHKLQEIHPFTNGNGRCARFIADLYLYSLFGNKPQWPELALKDENQVRWEYVFALKCADNGEFSFLEDLIFKYGGRNPSILSLFKQPFFKLNYSKAKLIEIMTNLAYFGSRIHGKFPHGCYPIQWSLQRTLADAAIRLIEVNTTVYMGKQQIIPPFSIN